MKKFNFDDYKGGYVMNCKTEEEANDFCNVMSKAGFCWRNNESYAKHTYYCVNKSGTCYVFNKGMYSDIGYCKSSGYTILEWSDFMEKKGNNTMENISVNFENLTEEERNTIIHLISKSKTKEVWKPKAEENYFCIDTSNSVIMAWVWRGDRYAESDYAIGNCFKTKEEAEFAIEKLKVQAELRHYAEAHNENGKETNYKIYYHKTNKSLSIQEIYCFLDESVTFTSFKIAEDAVTEIGADRIKKYLFNIA